MKILYISYDGLTDPLGQSQIAPYLRELAAKLASFTVLTFEKKRKFSATAEILDKRISWKKLKYHKHPAVVSTCYDIIRGIIAAIFISAKEKIEIVHARGYVSAAIALILKRLLGIRFIFDMRGQWAEEKVDAGIWTKDGFLYRATKYFEKLFFFYSDAIIVLTNNLQKLLAENPYAQDKDIVVIPTCADINNFLPSGALSIKRRFGLDTKFIVMYFGSLGTFYALKEMVDFFLVISKYYMDNPFLFIITNNPSDSIHRIIRFKNIPEGNFRIDCMEHQELTKVLPIANVSLMFYKRSLSKRGCCPTKFAESLSCGLPVVINSGIGDTEEIVSKEKIGVVVEEFSEEAYKRAAEQLMQLLAEKDVLRQRCLAIAEKYFSLSAGVEKYWQTYQKLLKR